MSNYKLLRRNPNGTWTVLVTFPTKQDFIRFLAKPQKFFPAYGFINIYDETLPYENRILSDISMSDNDLNDIGLPRSFRVLDADNRIVDIRAWYPEVKRTCEALVNSKFHWEDPSLRHIRYRFDPVPKTGKRGGYWHRTIKHWHRALKQDSDPDYKDFARQRAKLPTEPFYQYDCTRCIQKNWKAQSKKRHQWM